MAEEKEKLRTWPDTITCHAFNKNRTLVALCPNNHDIWIYDCSKGEDYKTWTRQHILQEHGGLVSDLDWSVKDQLVSCSHDRNAYVWNYDSAKKTWLPQVCLLRINRAATSVKWSPNGEMFAVTSGSKTVPVCRFDASGNWWVGSMIKKHKSTVLTCGWSADSKLLVTAGCDMKCRIITAEIDSDSFGEIIAEFDQTKAWVNCCAFSPDSKSIVFCGHGSTIHFADLSDNSVQTIQMNNLPFLSSAFVGNDSVVCVGYDFNPALFKKGSDGKWSFAAWGNKEGDAKKNEPVKVETAASKARDMFKQADSLGKKEAFGTAGAATTAKKAYTFHSNTITTIKQKEGSPALFSCSGLDARISFWDVSKF